MSNVHGFRDLNNDDDVERGNNQPNRVPLQNPWQAQDMNYGQGDQGGDNPNVPTIRAGGEDIPVTSLKPYHYLCLCCCPCCIGNPCSPNRKKMYIDAIKTFCFVITIVQVIMFILELSLGGVYTGKDSSILSPYPTAEVKLGAKYAYDIRYRFQLWRFLTPIFLHGGLFHILFNLYFQIAIAMSFEQEWGWKKFVPIYFVSGFGATLLSCLASPSSISVGASGALMGVLGAWLCHILCNWRRMPENTKKMQLFQCLLFIILIMIFGLFSTTIDAWAHLGGLLIGFVFSACFFNKESHISFIAKFGNWLGLITTLVYFLIGIVLFWTVVSAPNLGF